MVVQAILGWTSERASRSCKPQFSTSNQEYQQFTDTISKKLRTKTSSEKTDMVNWMNQNFMGLICTQYVFIEGGGGETSPLSQVWHVQAVTVAKWGIEGRPKSARPISLEALESSCMCMCRPECTWVVLYALESSWMSMVRSGCVSVVLDPRDVLGVLGLPCSISGSTHQLPAFPWVTGHLEHAWDDSANVRERRGTLKSVFRRTESCQGLREWLEMDRNKKRCTLQYRRVPPLLVPRSMISDGPYKLPIKPLCVNLNSKKPIRFAAENISHRPMFAHPQLTPRQMIFANTIVNALLVVAATVSASSAGTH
ncbi:hypothetical protein BJ138DRAFT_1104554 [Hygrophoropsis aurantiaca]|uniref:Uncharacterized protein n=1 Tax=Hygrophoropsis aurantiaca TaxID=72124 RepID=A0ACB8A2F0_9AGAM|nr:hypothetical protein BJ138DRAFT_1104554 [Hygrophoropsis aurantiaca]